jgi:hypothetical protein
MHRKELEDFLAAIEEFNKRYNTPELVRQYLQESGFIDTDGRLTEYYRSS